MIQISQYLTILTKQLLSKEIYFRQRKDFIEYIDNQLLSRQELPEMSPAFRKEIRKNIQEIFNNAVEHGGCDYVYTCGQYYPRMKSIKFSIVDFGKSIKLNVSQYLHDDKSAIDAIKWL